MRTPSAPPAPSTRRSRPSFHETLDVRAVADVIPADVVPAAAPTPRPDALAQAAVDTLVERLPVGVLLADRDGRVVYVSRAARRLDAERVEPVRWAITRALLLEDVVHRDALPVPVRGHARRWLDVDVAPVRDDERRITGAIATVADVTPNVRVAEWGPPIEPLTRL
jgi:PAS domain-containing protein